MIKLARNQSSNGFFVIRDHKGNYATHGINVDCSQAVKDNCGKLGGTVEVYFPNDWLIENFKHKDFLKFWADHISKFFSKVEYEGRTKIDELYKSAGVAYQLDLLKYPEGSYVLGYTSGNYIRNPRWHKFVIYIEAWKAGWGNNYTNLCTYASFVMIRYLYAQQYQPILLNYFAFLRNKSSYFPSTIENWQLMHLSHYGSSSSVGYTKKYSLISSNAHHEMCHRLMKLEDVKKHMHLSDSFILSSCPKENVTAHSVMSIESLLNTEQFSQAYEKIK